ncbi:unnamed protein product [Macrosiphum euphorbiae]|uniref:Uncharacterized protein n=1 Tax=Macrosiphum euphorbiae TaxID=13131 RepID=A0AAV0WXV7_9HEMI|nr:unnamed protein product [Macrosiphum euphorbiae]
MPYEWTLVAEDFESHSWCELGPSRRAVRGIMTKNMTVQTDCDAILKFIDELPNKNSPFSVTERFPENKIYVDLNHYHNVNNLRLMTIAACTFKGLQNVKTLNHQNGRGRNSAPTPLVEDRIYYKQVNDAIVSYSHAVHNLFAPHSICINDQHIFGIYTRASFEKQCSLVWI